MRKIRLLHITDDNKFFDGKLKGLSTDERIENIAYSTIYGIDKFKFIKSVENVIVLPTQKDMEEFLSIGNYDVVYFYSLNVENWWMLDVIPEDKVVIWWEWGYDIYYSQGGLDPLVNVSLYKPLSQFYYYTHPRKIFKPIYEYFKYLPKRAYLKNLQRRLLSRIDYVMPVIPYDFELLKKNPEFKASIFYTLIRTQNYKFTEEPHTHNGAILVGNSATLPNNHLDILSLIRKKGIVGRSIIVPMSYGDDNYGNYMKKHINVGDNNLQLLCDFMPKDEYFSIVDSCSYAIFGVMRQQAMGNIFRCIREGIKVFLYKDSIPYISLKESGYRVFAIEDISAESLSTPLSVEDNLYNKELFLKECALKNQIYEEIITKIYKRVNNLP